MVLGWKDVSTQIYNEDTSVRWFLILVSSTAVYELVSFTLLKTL